MKRTIYTLSLLVFFFVLTSAINSYKNTTVVLPPDDFVLELPNQTLDYSVDIPEHIFDMFGGWGIPPDTTDISSINSEVATLGRVLFYDVRLSGDNSLSCASCHKQSLSFSDNLPLSDGIEDNVTLRNSMPLNDLGWQISPQFFWDLRSSSLEDAVLQPITAAHELGKNLPDLIVKLENSTEYPDLFTNAFGDDEINSFRISVALADFIASMTTFESRFDQEVPQNFSGFTSSELLGMSLFEENCAFCHVTPHFGTAEIGFFIQGNNGLDSVFTDLGVGGWSNDPTMEGFFKSPSLRNIEATAPYMHDGRFETLEDVIDFYSEGIQFNENSFFGWGMGESFTGFDFTDAQKIDLLNFLRTLSDENLLSNEKWSNPWVNITGTEEEEAFKQSMNVYPNPVADMVVVELDNPFGKNFQISIFDIQGKLISSYKTADSILEIPRNGSPSGIYELVATSGKQKSTFKLVYR